MRCDFCAEQDHDSDAHRDITLALKMADACIRDGNAMRARLWIAVSAKLAKGMVKR